MKATEGSADWWQTDQYMEEQRLLAPLIGIVRGGVCKKNPKNNNIGQDMHKNTLK